MLIQLRALGEEGPEPEARPHGLRLQVLLEFLLAPVSAASWASGMRMGQTSSQRPQKVDALGRCLAFSMPTSAGVTTEPMGPG